MVEITFVYNYSIVLISIVISIFLCVITLDLLRRVRGVKIEKKEKALACSKLLNVGKMPLVHAFYLLTVSED